MKIIIAALALIASPAVADGLVGKPFNTVIRGTPYDPAKIAPRPIDRKAFTATLNGPQTPGVVVALEGREYLVYESCTAHLCAASHSVTVIDRENGSVYAAVYDDAGKTVVVPNSEIAKVVGDACDANRCSFENITEVGAVGVPESLRAGDFAGFSPTRACQVYGSTGLVMFYQGRGVMRFRGVRRTLVARGENGFYSNDSHVPIVVSFRERQGRSARTLTDHMTSIEPRTMTVMINDTIKVFPVTVRCEQ